MIDFDVLKSTLKKPRILLPIVAAVLIVLIWTIAFFLPEGKKINTLKTQQDKLQAQITAGNDKIKRLSHTYQHSAQLKALQNQLNSTVPSTSDAYNYVQALSTVAKDAGVHLTSVSITGGGRASTDGLLVETPVTMSVTGTYDQLLTVIKNIYALPRLTDIEGIVLNGGGPGTDRSTQLTASLSLLAFSASKPAEITKGRAR
jgi:Tfp pilus assembly protein PilO